MHETLIMHAFKEMASPVGRLKLVANKTSLVAVLWENDRPNRIPFAFLEKDENHPVLMEAGRQLSGYFAGQLKSFSIKLDFAGTDFQKKVWAALLEIPFGETRTYGEIAKRIGNPKAVRAVGAANGRNPISIIAPCHRVVGADGTLTGFAGGLEAKAVLLRIESPTGELWSA